MDDFQGKIDDVEFYAVRRKKDYYVMVLISMYGILIMMEKEKRRKIGHEQQQLTFKYP